MLASDMNQNIVLSKVQQFFSEIGIQDIHHAFNNIPLDKMDNTHQKGSKPLDTIAISLEIIECIEECLIIETNEIIIIDHHLCLVDINFENYF